MKTHKKGVSLVVLLITVAVMIIAAVAVIETGRSRTDDAKLAKHNQNISITQEEVENYYYYKGEKLPVVNETPYSIPAGSSLMAEVTKNGEQADNFYVLDMSKLGKTAGEDGTGVGDDIYIVSATRHTVYYVRGTTIDRTTYHGLTSKGNVKLAEVTPISAGGSSEFDGTVNKPKLAAGMIPVKWSGSNWVDLTSEEQQNASHEWYDYSKPTNKWANVRLKDNSLLVWIPRYTYKISPDPAFPATSGEHKSTAGIIDIKFSNGATDDTSGDYRVQPAFYWGGWTIPISAPMVKQAGGTELTGIWIGKFEPSNNGGKIKIIANAASLAGGLNVDSIFTKCLNMKNDSTTYGDLSAADTHMLKNSEWGAAAYLSKYALGSTEVEYNPSGSYITANGNIVTYKAESTTGNEYGVYDMSGCAAEYVAAYIDNGFSSDDGNSVRVASGQYKDVFPVSAGGIMDSLGNYDALSQAYGHAIYETSTNYQGIGNWYADVSNMLTGSYPWLVRGGYSAYDATDMGLFCFGRNDGYSHSAHSFRVSIIVL